MLLLFILAWLHRLYRRLLRSAVGRAPASYAAVESPPCTTIRSQPKPPWVSAELIRMKAFAPELGCRKLADAFNRRFAETERVTVSKSHVGRVLLRGRADVARLRRSTRHRVPRSPARNGTWALDLTQVPDLELRQQLVLGIVDHGTRACIALSALADKRSLTILREIAAAIRRFGVPRRIRVDNEACLKSRLMRLGLFALGVRLQFIEPFCPWQNGRIERFFGAFKRAVRLIPVSGVDDLRIRLIEFRAFYNHVRSHQHLNGRTPAEAWADVRKAHGIGQFISTWNGALAGWYFPRE